MTDARSSRASRIPRRLKVQLRVVVIALLALVATVVPVESEPASAAISFHGWTYDFSVGGNDGLRLDDVSYNGLRVFDRISLPVMNVFYQNNVCGPFSDKLGGNQYTGPFGNDFTQNGVRWRSIGLTDQIGQYEITMTYYMSENGDFDAHIFSRGLQCNAYHEHVPFWRIDFDLAGLSNDRVYRSTGNGNFAAETTEFSSAATAAANHGWEVRDTVTGDRVTIDFDTGTFTIPGQVIPESDYVNNKVFGRQYNSTETVWSGGASRDLFGDQNETINDLVLWYSGFMPHSGSEGPTLWHSTGIRMKVNPGGGNQQATVGGTVVNEGGSAMAGVQVDLFAQNANGSKGQWITSSQTAGNGTYSFSTDPGCRIVVFIAPTGQSFQGGGQYLERSTCVSAGQSNLTLNAVINGGGLGQGSIGDRVTNAGGGGVGGVSVDLFTANGDGSRGSWLRSVQTNGNGNYSFAVNPACYVITFIAPTGQTFQGGGQYLQRPVCITAGQTDNSVDAVIDSGGGTPGVIGDRVTRSGGGGVGNVLVDLYAAAGDGSRGQWIRGTRTNSNGNYSFSTGAACYVLVFVAPNGESFVGGGQYLQRSVCIAAGQTNNGIDAVLS